MRTRRLTGRLGIAASIAVVLTLLGAVAASTAADTDTTAVGVSTPVADAAGNQTVLPRHAGLVDEPVSEAPAQQLAVISTAGMLLRVVLGLAMVMGILGAVLFLYKKATRGGPGFRGDAIQVLAQKGLSQRAGLVVVRVAGETLLLGITQNQVTALSRLGGTDPKAEGRAPEARALTADAAAIDALIGEVGPAPEAPSFERTLAGEVKRVRENLWTSLKRVDL